MTGCDAFHADNRGDRCFARGRAIVHPARSLLGADYNHCDHAIFVGAAFAVSSQRFFGTELGAAVGAIVATYLGHTRLVFAMSVFVLGLLCAAAHLERSAYRFEGIALTIVLLLPWKEPAWQVAFHRFAEVSIGIGVALLSILIWPEAED